MRVNGWVALARACQQSPLERMVALGVRLQASRSVPHGRVYVINPDALSFDGVKGGGLLDAFYPPSKNPNHPDGEAS